MIFVSSKKESQSSKMNRTSYILVLFIVMILEIDRLKGADPFEAFFQRFQCFGDKRPPGCGMDFIEAHPEFSRASDNITTADTFIYLFTPEIPDEPELWHNCPEFIPPNTYFDSRRRTEIVIPGWLCGPCNMAIFREIKNELMKEGRSNVFLIDYMWGNSVDYKTTYENLGVLANQLAYLVKIIKETYQLKAKDFICTGHSFGAHTCGLLSAKSRVAIINGLDPAGGVITENTPLDERLDEDDAKCVQVIHTNGGQCLPQYLGCNFTCGTVDIWPNGGVLQNSDLCRYETFVALAKQDIIYAFLNIVACSHLEALQFYKASINVTNEEFVAIRRQNYQQFQRGMNLRCRDNGENCVAMGTDCCDCLQPGHRRGGRSRNFYLNTTNSCPYIDNSKIETNGFHCKLQ